MNAALTVSNCFSMENSVLGNALEGVPEEEEEEKPKESNVDSTENIDGGKYKKNKQQK